MTSNFGEDWLRGIGVARGRIFAFSIDLLRRHLNTRISGECVISLTTQYSGITAMEA